MVAKLIVVSCARDLAINTISVPGLMQHIRASSYSVIVPDRDLPAFRAALPREAELVAEESLLNGRTAKEIGESLPAAVAARAGWYFQQLLKIEAVRRLPGSDEALIWDGDTIPLRPIEFKDAADRIGFYVGREYNESYFGTTQRLIGLGKVAPHSFIAQCMFVRARWIHELVDDIERRAGMGWVEAILRSIPGRSPSEFSEYETIGTFVSTAHPAQIFINRRPWFRWGMSYFGGIDRVNAAGLRRLARVYDYVALERWDRGAVAWVRGTTARCLDGARRHRADGGAVPLQHR